MDQEKIGRFIAELRKKNKMTQQELADKLNVTDRAIGNWENGRRLPDAVFFKPLCEIFDISIQELFSGEMIDVKDVNKKNEELLLELAEADVAKNKSLLIAMYTIMITSTIFYIAFLLFVCNYLEEGILHGSIIVISTIIYLIAMFIGFKFEVEAGYYECRKCHHKFKASYAKALSAMHLGTTRHLRCPECNKKSWAKKVMDK